MVNRKPFEKSLIKTEKRHIGVINRRNGCGATFGFEILISKTLSA
ncbi:MAG: hypothetical protein PHE01_11035 [Methanosarcina sp.]|nr:hypothetical protein [Methanosarcina sp.]